MNPTIVLQFDLRHGPDCPDSQQERYQACLQMVKWADQNRVSVVGFSEHHNTSDGFLSSPIMMAMAAAGVSERVAISVSALLLPLHDPIRIAEDIAVLDLVSNGRFMAVAGLGYREIEYQSMGVEWRRRGEIFDQKLAVVLQAWKGEPFSYRGSSFQLNPVPLRQAAALLCIGGNSAAAARRAAKFGLMFAPPIDDPKLREYYDEAALEYGFDGGAVIFPREPSLTLISTDPDRDWHSVGKYLLYDAQAYRQWKHKSRRAFAESAATTLEELRAEGKYCILTPDEAVQKIKSTGVINLSPLCGGVPVDYAWQSLELFSKEVLPLI